MCRIEPSKWEEATNLKKYEISTFIDINLLMEIKPLPSYGYYSCSSRNFHDAYVSHFMVVECLDGVKIQVHLDDNIIPKYQN